MLTMVRAGVWPSSRSVPASGDSARMDWSVAVTKAPTSANRQSHEPCPATTRRPTVVAVNSSKPPISSVLWMAYVISHSSSALAACIAELMIGKSELAGSIGLSAFGVCNQPLHFIQVLWVDLLFRQQVADERRGRTVEQQFGQVRHHRATHLRLGNQR